MDIDRDEFPRNSRTPPVERRIPEVKPKKEIKKVVSGEVTRRKPSRAKRLKEMFIGEDAENISLTDYILGDMIVPALKDLLHDVIVGSTERKLFGGDVSRGGRRGYRGRPGPHINYGAISRGREPVGRASGRHDREDPRDERVSRTARARHDFDTIVIESLSEANEVLSQMYDLLERYEVVTVSDLYELLGVSGNFTDERYGWTNLFGSRVSRVSGGGYVLDLPPTEVLER